MNAAPHRQKDTKRKADLAKIHIARKDLRLDEDTYRQIIRDIGGMKSGSSADLDAAGRHRVLKHFMDKGWKPTLKGGKRKPTAARNNALMASGGQVRLVRHIWICMADAGVVKSRDETGLRAWVRSASRRYHPQNAGYSAPEFLPDWVAIIVIEHLKKWAKRCDVQW